MLEKEVAASEPICRFIMGTDYYRPSDKSVRHNAFMPNKHGETSVYRTIALNAEKIYDLGERFVAPARKKPIKGWADILASRIMEQQLRVDPKPHPHHRHANIVDWPEDREKNRLIAIKLASESELHLLEST